MSCFRNQIAVVTGASSGIGRAIALAFGRQGAEVYLVARRRKALESVARRIRLRSGQAHVCCADLTSDSDISNLAELIQHTLGSIAVLVVCGGAMYHGTTLKATLDQLDMQYRSNLRGHYALIHALLPLVRKHKGQIVFINSSVAMRPSTRGAGQYAAMQHALRAIADSLRDEVNQDGIRVLSIYAGRTATPRMADLFLKEGRPYHPELLMQPEDVATMVIHALSLRRTAEVTDISMRPMVKCY